MVDYKKLYLKYKKKYINAKKIYGGNSEEEIILIDKLYNDEMKKLIKIKNTYESKFNKGLTEGELFEFIDKIYKMGKNIEKKTKYSMDQQRIFLEKKNNIKRNNRTFNDILFFQIIREFLNRENANDINKLVKYLEKQNIKLDNNKLSKYKTGKLLGQGAFGAVYKLSDEKVLKIINASNYVLPKKKEMDEWGEGLDQVVNEIKSMEKLNETEISPKIYDYWISNNNNSLQVYIVMEFKGITLNNWLYKENRELKKEEKDIIEKKIDIMHKKGIVHRDLHSDNILVEEKNGKTDFFISDFGLSKTKKILFDSIKKEDYVHWKPYIKEYDMVLNYLVLIIKILGIQLIKK